MEENILLKQQIEQYLDFERLENRVSDIESKIYELENKIDEAISRLDSVNSCDYSTLQNLTLEDFFIFTKDYIDDLFDKIEILKNKKTFRDK